ncbi:MAG TPA: hypothetical protein PK186_00875 [candidate division Zixibacteria bacterium]|nr:hypothetical protein [candidate division Zixibacteria bacterium]MDD4917202.1 hypothetical protein [candidate division Zixibacteria bacterium]MDM7971668.1 hypothetical protein [candidate division Zixibacteria bacterium]HPM36091.1 hypothetical protein [candidate division Zixibacteria bacterium]
MNGIRLILAVATGALLAACAHAAGGDRIYARVVTVDGDEYEGLIRWDKNEASWADMLDGIRSSEKGGDDSDRTTRGKTERRIKIFGFTVGTESDSWWSPSAQCGVRFGHLRRLQPLGDDRALLEFKSGQRVELSGGSTDLGDGVREIVVEDPGEGEVHLVWGDIEEVIFQLTDKDSESVFGERLYGTLTTRRGETFTGFIAWDVDEVFGQDVLDGEEGDRSRKIQFAKIKTIERYSSSGATVSLVSGSDELVLRGTNDVNDDNRGIIVADPSFGQVIVGWDEFERVEFSRPNEDRASYDAFDGGRPLSGKVATEDGKTYTGRIRWDDDESHTWEILDGDSQDIQFDIEFGAIKRIEKRTNRSSMVTLWDGREFRLRGSNDVDSDNKGIFVTQGDGETVEVAWEDFASVEFDRR